MIILRQKNYSILNKLGGIGNYIENRSSFCRASNKGQNILEKIKEA